MCAHLHQGATSCTDGWDLKLWPHLSPLLAVECQRALFFTGDRNNWGLGFCHFFIRFLVPGMKTHIMSKPHLLWIPESFAQMTVYTSPSLWHPHGINSSIQARFLYNFMAVWIPIGLCMNTFWLSLPHSWSRAINLLHKIYFHTCTEVGKENVWKCQGDVTCHRDGKSYVGQVAGSGGYNTAYIHTYILWGGALSVGEVCVSTYKAARYARLLFGTVKYRTIETHAVQCEHKRESC